MATRRTRTIVIILAIAIVAVGGYFLTRKRTKTAATTYTTSAATKGTLVVSVSASGTVASTDRVSVTTGVTGTVATVYVKNGDTVKAGQKLMTMSLDTTSELSREQASISLQSSKDALAMAKNNLVNAKAAITSAQNAITQAQADKTQAYTDYQTAVTAYNTAVTNDAAVSSLATTDPTRVAKDKALTDATTAKAQALSKYNASISALTQAKLNLPTTQLKATDAATAVTKAQTDLKVAQNAYDATSPTITAPRAGVVADVTIAAGATLSTSASSSAQGASSAAGTKVASIMTGNPQTITVTLQEADIPKVASGQAATITVDAIADKTFTGKVIGVDTSGTVSSGVTSYTATVQFDKVAAGVLPNMSATVDIITSTKTDVVLVPVGAVKTSNGQTTVQVMKNGTPSTVDVTVGLESDSQAEIVSGVSVGDEVVTATITANSNTNASKTSTGASSLFGGTTSTRGFSGGGAVQFQGAPPGL